MADASDTTAPIERDAADNLDGLYRRYRLWVGSVLRRQPGIRTGETEDLVQETYLRAARYAPDDVNRHPKALLHRIAVNLARDHMRRSVVRGGTPDSLDDDQRMATPPALSSPAEQEQELLLKQIVLGLPSIYRDVFLLSRFTGMTYGEIASHLGIAVKTVEWRMSKALALCTAQMRE